VIKGNIMISHYRSKFLASCMALVLPLMAAADDPLWVDVRSATEYSQGHVEQAVNIPHTEIAAGITELGTEPDAVIYVYCRSGRRSGIAKETLEGMGYTAVVNLGGFEDAMMKAEQLSGH
jgi:phage shock protein E